MGRRLAALLASRSSWFDLCVFALGLAVVAYAVASVVLSNVEISPKYLLTIPLIAVIARFPMILDSGEGGIEVGFDSTVLIFLACMLPSDAAVVLWSVGVLVTQVSSDKRPMVKVFNIGLGIIAGALAATVYHLVVLGSGSGAQDHLPELVAVALAAAAYFAADFLISAVSVAVETRSSLREHLVQKGTLVAVLSFVPFDLMGYLGVMVVRHTPPFTLILLAVPLATLLVATRAVTRGGENSRRLAVLFAAAMRAQTLSDTRQVLDALVDDAQKLLRIRQIEVRSTPPGAHEVGAQLRDGQRDRWIVAPARHRARSTTTADQQALEAMVAVSSDAFERLRLTEDMTHLARHDLLTNLPNRGLLLDRVEHALEMSRRRSTRIALLFVDLDGFKPVNDTYGHSIGDLVLEQVGQRLKGMSRGKDVVARVGGDEFLLLLTNVSSQEAIAHVADRLIQGLSHPYAAEGREVMISCSVGIAMYPDGCSHAKLIARADAAMYASKRSGGSKHCFYSNAMDADAEAQFELLRDLRKAVVAKEFELFYQPKIDSKSGKVTAVEALLRWKHPTRGLLLPSTFIPIAERFGLIGAIGNWVIEDACRQSRQWREKGVRMRVAINLSAHQMRQDDIVERITGALHTHKIHPSLLTCEITESAAMEDTKTTQTTFRRLGELGTHLSIDDFGTGYSSLSYLRKLPAEELKIDRSFIQDLEHSADARAVVDAVIKLAHALGLKVVAEGVENQRQQEVLVKMGCDELQGFLFAKPMSARALMLWAVNDRSEGASVFKPSLFDETRQSDSPTAARRA
jgi:diguanylate cyclase (GGDEF)-like protein